MNNLNKQSREYLLKESVYRRIGVIMAEALGYRVDEVKFTATVTSRGRPGKPPRTKKIKGDTETGEGTGILKAAKARRQGKGRPGVEATRDDDGLGNKSPSTTVYNPNRGRITTVGVEKPDDK